MNQVKESIETALARNGAVNDGRPNAGGRLRSSIDPELYYHGMKVGQDKGVKGNPWDDDGFRAEVEKTHPEIMIPCNDRPSVGYTPRFAANYDHIFNKATA